MTTYDRLWSMSGEKTSFGFKNSFFFRIWCSKTVILDSVRLPAREVTHNDVRFWITKCHLQEHSELGLKEMVVFYFHTELHWNSEIMLFNNIHNTQYILRTESCWSTYFPFPTFISCQIWLAVCGSFWFILRTASLPYGARLGTQLFNMSGEPLGFAPSKFKLKQ